MLHSRVAFTIGSISIYWYGITITLAMLLALCTAASREKMQGFARETVLDFAFWAIPAALVCARVYYVAFAWDSFRGDIWRILDVRKGGLAIYGGILGGIFAAAVFTKKRHIRFAALADLIAPSLALGQGIGRWGNFFNQEAYGVQTLSPAWQFFPASVYIEANGQWHMATFFYESVWCIAIWLVLACLLRRSFFAKRGRGDCFAWYGLLYCAERAVVEGLRTDSLYLGSIRISQAASILLLVAVLVWFFLRGSKRNVTLLSLCLACTLASLLMALGVLPANELLMLCLNAAALVGGSYLYAHIPVQN